MTANLIFWCFWWTKNIKRHSPIIWRSFSWESNCFKSKVQPENFYKKPVKTDVCSYVPSVEIDDGAKAPIAEENICIFKGEVDRSYTSVFSVDLVNGNLIDSKSTVGGGTTIYANTSSLYLAANDVSVYYARSTDVDYKNKTRLIRFDIKDGVITPAAEGEVDGTPLNQFSMDEMGGYFRIVTTVTTAYNTTNAVYVLNKELKIG